MSKQLLTKAEIIKRGNALNRLHEAYKQAPDKEKPFAWQRYLNACMDYKEDVHAYIGTSQDISGLL